MCVSFTMTKDTAKVMSGVAVAAAAVGMVIAIRRRTKRNGSSRALRREHSDSADGISGPHPYNVKHVPGSPRRRLNR